MFHSQYNATFSATFASPGTGKILGVEHACGIYLLHQCDILRGSDAVSSESKSDSVSKTCEIDGNEFRQLMKISPFAAMSPTTPIYLSPIATGGLDEVSTGYTISPLAVAGEGQIKVSVTATLETAVDVIIMELQRLC